MAHAKASESTNAAITLTTQSGLLLFYRIDTGLATVGRIDEAGNYTDLKDHRFDKDWVRLFPLGNGFVAFKKRPRLGGELLVGRVQPDGSYQDLKVHTSFFNDWATLVAVNDNLVLVHHSPRDVTIMRVKEDGDFDRLRTHGGFDDWGLIVSTHDGLLLFYNQTTGKAATIRVKSDGTYQDLHSYSGFDPWTHMISTTNRILLFYNQYTGAAATGRMDADGDYKDLGTYQFDRDWRDIVPTLDGHVLFSNFGGGPPRPTVLGRIDANGGYDDGPVLNGVFDPWNLVVPVI